MTLKLGLMQNIHGLRYIIWYVDLVVKPMKRNDRALRAVGVTSKMSQLSKSRYAIARWPVRKILSKADRHVKTP
jgi:hypothetical protein